jgi:hypothetical protein
MTHKLHSTSFWSLLASLLFGFYLFLPPLQALANVWVGDCSNNTLSKISPNGEVLATYDLTNPYGGIYPANLFFDGSNVWVADYGGYPDGATIKLSPSGVTTTYATISPNSIGFDGTNIWVLGYGYWRITPTGSITGFPASPFSNGWGDTNGRGGVTFDGNNIWFAALGAFDRNGNAAIAKIDNSGSGYVSASYNVNAYTFDLAFDGSNIWVASNNIGGSSGYVTKVSTTGNILNTYTLQGLNPYAIAFDGTNMWTANYSSSSVSKISPNGNITTYNGIIGNPNDIAFDGTNIWTANNNTISKITLTGQITNYSISGCSIVSDRLVFPYYPTINFLFPANGTTTADFLNWSVDIEGTTSTMLTARVDYGLTPSFGLFDEEATGVGIRFITKTNSLTSNSTYYAQASLYDFQTLIATSSVIFFSVSPVVSSTPFSGSLASSTITCSTGNFLSDSFCDMLVFLFVPNADEKTDISGRLYNLKSAVSNKPPFGYFALINNALGGITEGTTTATTTLSSLASSTIQSFSSIFSPFYNFFVILLWFLLATWLFHRFRLFNF